jgi:hypothetical protein
MISFSLFFTDFFVFLSFLFFDSISLVDVLLLGLSPVLSLDSFTLPSSSAQRALAASLTTVSLKPVLRS